MSGAAAPGAGAVERLFDAHAERLCRYIYRYVRSRETAQDLVQDLFLRLWDKRRELESVRDLEGYLYAAARNRALTYVRQQRIQDRWQRQQAAPAARADDPPPPKDPAEELVSAEIAATLQKTVDALPARQREVLLLQWSGQSYDQIAKALNISPKTVSNHLTRAVEHLRQALPRLIR